MRTCTKCLMELSEESFYVKDSSKNRLHTQCKDCYKERRSINYRNHYVRYREEYRLRAKSNREKYKEAFHEKMLEYLENKSCVICNEDDNRVLEFDHIDPTTKLFGISQATRMGYKWDKVLTEINKCRILCANCHKKHTATQFNWYKS